MTRFTTPDGKIVDVITISGSGGPNSPDSRDYHVEGPGGDGQWFRVKHPNGILLKLARTTQELADLGIDIGTLKETKR